MVCFILKIDRILLAFPQCFVQLEAASIKNRLGSAHLSRSRASSGILPKHTMMSSTMAVISSVSQGADMPSGILVYG